MRQVKRHRPIQKGSMPRLPRHEGMLPPHSGVVLSPESVEAYLAYCREQGYSAETLQGYRRKLEKLWEDLPEDKTIRPGFMDSWRTCLLEEGYSASTVNGFLTASNTFLEFIGHRELQAAEKVKLENAPQPELTRAEYLRLLQAARHLDREKGYLLVKLFANTPLNVQELPKVTVEAAREGQLESMSNGVKTPVRFPKYLRRELLDYAGREGRLSGPIFVTREGTPISRTYVTTILRQLCPAARVPEEKGNPRCLRRLYQSTLADIEANVALLVEQAMERQLETEQMSAGWEE